MNIIKWLAIAALVALAVLAMAFAKHVDDVNGGFEGACTYLHGQVEGDVCIKDGRVILTKDQFKERM